MEYRLLQKATRGKVSLSRRYQEADGFWLTSLCKGSSSVTYRFIGMIASEMKESYKKNRACTIFFYLEKK